MKVIFEKEKKNKILLLEFNNLRYARNVNGLVIVGTRNDVKMKSCRWNEKKNARNKNKMTIITQKRRENTQAEQKKSVRV